MHILRHAEKLPNHFDGVSCCSVLGCMYFLISKSIIENSSQTSRLKQNPLLGIKNIPWGHIRPGVPLWFHNSPEFYN